MKKKKTPSQNRFKQKISRLESELADVKETLRAIQSGEVDALVVRGAHGEHIYTLQSTDQPYRILVENMSEGAATLSQDGTVFYCNQRFAQMLQTTLDSLIGSSLHAFIPAGDIAAFTKLFEKGKRDRSKATMRMKTFYGNFIPAFLSMSAVDIEGGPGVCLIAADMSEHHRFEESQADVERLNIEKDLRERFVSTLSHDLRNPLAAAKINTQMMLRHAELGEKFLLIGGKILKNIGRADMMIQNMLDANHIRAGERLPLEVGKCDLRQITQDVLEELVSIHGDRFNLLARGPVLGFWSATQLRRVVENLANNAIKYGSAYAPVTVKLEEVDGNVTIAVHNQGSFLSPEEQVNIFKSYSRTAGAIASGQRGWGLGLTLVRGVVEAHGGKVQVESSLSKGTTFLVTIPTGTAND